MKFNNDRSKITELPRKLLSLDELKETNEPLYSRLKYSHIVSLMDKGSMIYGPGVTLLMTLPKERLNIPKYFTYIYPGGINAKEKCLLKIKQNTLSGEPLYLGAMSSIVQEFSSPKTHINAVTDASVYRVSDIDSCLFLKENGDVMVNAPESVLAGEMPQSAQLRMKGGIVDPGRWLSYLFMRTSPDYVLGTFQNYIKAGITVQIGEILEILRVISRTLKLEGDDLTPMISTDDNGYPDWLDILKNSPLLRGWAY